MSDALEFDRVSKSFQYWEERPESIKTFLVDIIRGRWALGKKFSLPVLKDFNLRVRSGEFVGILGRNGAGKSTVMKLACGIYRPDSGEIRTAGKIAPLIELGAGFNPELSGYENIFLNSAILGFGKAVTEAAVPKIIEFSELGDLLNMQVKKYSSGMLVRLGFAIATHLPFEIMLCDEILAVGDPAFQKKCIAKIQELHRDGRTILLITHDLESVLKFCNRCVVIEDHKIAFDGPPVGGVAHFRHSLGV